MKQLQAKINGKWHEVCCVELQNEAKSLIGSFAVDDIRLTDTPEKQKYEERRKLYQENGKKIIEIAHRYGIHELDLLKAMDEVKSLPIQEQPTQEIEPLLPNGAYSQQGYGKKYDVEDVGDKLNEIIAAVNALQKGR